MAYCKIHPIKVSVSKAIAYICNADKTEENILVDSFACAPETADITFGFALSNTCNKSDTKAYHLIQSFAPGEVTHEEAHRIGKELADSILGGNYSYVITTHTDKGHPHNHIIFCAADNINHRKYNDCKKTYYHIRRTSDSLCREHGLSVIEPSGKKGKSYAEWRRDSEGRSWKTALRKDINDAIRACRSYEDFLGLLRDKGYEIKGETADGTLKYISFKAPGQQRFIRGSERSLGANYTRDAILSRIKESQIPKPRDPSSRMGVRRSLIDTSKEKFQDSPGLKRWATIQNLKTAADSYSKAGSMGELQDKIDAVTRSISENRSQLVALDNQIRELSEALSYATQYANNRIFNYRYKKSKDPDRYMQSHESQLMLFDAANKKLRDMGIDPEKMDVEKMHADLLSLKDKRLSVQGSYKSLQKEEKELRQHMKNLSEFMGRTEQETERGKDEKSQKKSL